MGVSGTGCSCLQTRQKNNKTTHTHRQKKKKKTTETLVNVRPSACLSTIICPWAAHFVFKLSVRVTAGRREDLRRPVWWSRCFIARQTNRRTKQFASYAGAEPSRAEPQLVTEPRQRSSPGWHITVHWWRVRASRVGAGGCAPSWQRSRRWHEGSTASVFWLLKWNLPPSKLD